MTERSTKRQKELLSFVDGFIQGHGYGPSYREIMRALGYKSVSTVAIHVDGLITRGYLAKRDNSARSLEVVSTRMDDKPKSTKPSAHEKWLVEEITRRLDGHQQDRGAGLLDEAYVLTAALKTLGFQSSYDTLQQRLEETRTKT